MTIAAACSTPWLGGFIADLPTPFDRNGEIDWASLEMLCEHQIRSGVTAILVGETMGEVSTLSQAEHDAIIRVAVKTSHGRAAVIAGAGSNSTSQAIDLTMGAESNGADAILSVVPYYNKPMQAGIVAHFRAIAASTMLPIILHDASGRTTRELSDDTMQRLAESAQFVGVKDAAGNLGRLLRWKAFLPANFRLLTGEDSTASNYLLGGGDGCISIVSNVAPDLCRRMHQCCKQADVSGALSLALRLAQLATALCQDSAPATLKYGLSLLGLMHPGLRLPLVEPDQASKNAIADAIAAVLVPNQASEAVARREVTVV
jgi:4-hydroxy-tetrahydrodipicolinate synthase